MQIYNDVLKCLTGWGKEWVNWGKENPLTTDPSKQEHTVHRCRIPKLRDLRDFPQSVFLFKLQYNLWYFAENKNPQIVQKKNQWPHIIPPAPFSHTHPCVPVFPDRIWRPALPVSSSKFPDDESFWVVVSLCLSSDLRVSLTVAQPASVWLLSVCTPAVSLPVLVVSSGKEFTFDCSFLPPAHLYLTLTHREREGEEEGKGMERAASKLSVLQDVFSSLKAFCLSIPSSFVPPWKWWCCKDQPVYNTHFYMNAHARTHTQKPFSASSACSNRVCCQSVVVGRRQTVEWAVRFSKRIISLEFTQATPAYKLSPA